MWMPLECGQPCSWGTLSLPAFDLFRQDDGFGDFLHGLAPLAALFLNRRVRLLLVESQLALQDALGALHQLPCFELLGELGDLAFEARHLDLGAHQESNSRT